MHHQENIAFFKEVFGHAPSVTKSSPASIDLLGRGAELNQGYALSMAVDYYSTVSTHPIEGSICYLSSKQCGSQITKLALSDLEKVSTQSAWIEPLKNLLLQFKKRNIPLQAFELTVDSTIPDSSGLDQVSAFGVAFTTALNSLLTLNLPPLDLAQLVESKTNLLTPLTSLCNQQNKLLFSEHLEHTTQSIPFPPDFCFLLINTGQANRAEQTHLWLEDAQAVKKHLKTTSLREVSLADLRQAKETIPTQIYRYALHALTENERVLESIDYLNSGNIDIFGELLFESHGSVQENLESSNETLDSLIRLAHQSVFCKGACLYGGDESQNSSIHLVDLDSVELYQQEVREKCPPDIAQYLSFHLCHPTSGTLFASFD